MILRLAANRARDDMDIQTILVATGVSTMSTRRNGSRNSEHIGLRGRLAGTKLAGGKALRREQNPLGKL